MFKYDQKMLELKKRAASENLKMEYTVLASSHEYCAVMCTVSSKDGSRREVSFGETADLNCNQPLHEAVQEAAILGLEAFFEDIQEAQSSVIEIELNKPSEDKEDFRLELGKYQQRGEVLREDNWISQILQYNPAFINDILTIHNPTPKSENMVNRTKRYVEANGIQLEEVINQFNEQKKQGDLYGLEKV